MKGQYKHILTWLGLVFVMPFAVPYVFSKLFYRVPPRPASVPAFATPIRKYEGETGVWWWAACREIGRPRYACRLFDQAGSLAVSGRFVAVARRYEENDAWHEGFVPAAGKPLHYGSYQSGGEILLSPPGCWLLPQEWIYFPNTRTKASVSPWQAGVSLGPRVPMTDEDLRAATVGDPGGDGGIESAPGPSHPLARR